MFFRTPYNYDTDVSSHQSGLDCSTDVDRAQQHFKDECDINVMVKTYARTGEIPGSEIPAYHFDFDGVFDYQTAMNQLVAADRAFAALPSELRERFGHDAGRFLSFIENPDNRDEAVRLKLVAPLAEPEPVVPPQPTTE